MNICEITYNYILLLNFKNYRSDNKSYVNKVQNKVVRNDIYIKRALENWVRFRKYSSNQNVVRDYL